MTKSLLITGATGSFGQEFISSLISEKNEWDKIIIFSRDELKQWEMQAKFPQEKFKKLRYFLGDIRDYRRLKRAFEGVDTIIHAAALKQVPAAEYNPTEFINTNIHGSQNVIEAASDCGVKNIISLSTDKASAPVNLDGATKLCSDKLFIAANNIVGSRDLKFSVVRYGNVMGSRGSVIPLFIEQAKKGFITLTDPEMTRFNIILDEGVNMVLWALENSLGEEIFVPKIPSYKITDVVKAVAPNIVPEIKGLRPGEKIHEELISNNENYFLFETKDYFILVNKTNKHYLKKIKSKMKLKKELKPFSYNSETNKNFLTVKQIAKLIKKN